jgi:hypothetical protein
MTPVLFDFETCSAADLRAVGGRNYAAHESTRILIGVFFVDETLHVWLPGQDIKLPCFQDLWPKQFGSTSLFISPCGDRELPLDVKEAVLDGRQFIAHNCDDFDSHIWRQCIQAYWPDSFGDTIHWARAAGLPASLDALGKRFFGFGKDAGHSLMLKMSKLECEETKWGRRWINKHQTPGNIAAVARYAIGDVVILERVYKETLGFQESGVISVSNQINDRGIAFDAGLARKLVDFSNRASEEAGQRIEELTKGELKAGDLRSIPKMKAWLQRHGVEVENLRKQTVEAVLENPDEFLTECVDDAY